MKSWRDLLYAAVNTVNTNCQGGGIMHSGYEANQSFINVSIHIIG